MVEMGPHMHERMGRSGVIGLALLAFVACGDDDDNQADAPTTAEGSTAPTEASATTESATTEAPTTEAPTTTERVTTTQRATTTTAVDPLTAALVAAGFQPPDSAIRSALQTFCDEFTARSVEAINEVAGSEPGFQDLVRAGFGVMCPDNVAAVGVPVMPNGDPAFPSYPRIVDVGTIDSRVASWFEGKLVDGQVVALAPGVYTPYNPAVPNLIAYLDGPNDGDCVMRDQYFPNTGGACWDGVQPGSAEQ